MKELRPRSHGAAVALALMVGLPAATLGPASAVTTEPLHLRPLVMAQTPRCEDFPEYPIVGRVSGFVNDEQPRGITFVGCFPSFAACEAWRLPVSGLITERLRLNECTVR